MKIIEALKRIKEYEQKVTDLKERVGLNCTLTSLETPRYGSVAEQTDKIKEWMQSIRDTLFEIERLRVAIQKTNLETLVEIELPGGNTAKKSIAAWIHRRRDLAKSEIEAWKKLGDRGLQEGKLKSSQAGEYVEVKLIRFFDPSVRDDAVDNLTREPSAIDSRLEIINAVTDLIE